MIKYLALILSFPFIQLNAQINRIDHIYIESSKAEELYHFFKNEINLPVAWNYQEWGNFSSGGLFLGNANVEFIYVDTICSSVFKGIALEPNVSASKIRKDLDKRHIDHNGLDNFYDPRKNRSVGNILWSTIDLTDLLPQNIHFFICDYKNKKQLQAKSKKQKKLFLKKQKTGLNVIRINALEIGVLNPDNTETRLKKLPGIITNGERNFCFKQGMKMKISESTIPGIIQINLLVKSKEKARQYLKSKKWLEENRLDNKVFIDPQLIDNLRIEFIEEN